MKKKVDMEENLLCLAAGIFLAIVFIALACGDSNKGLLDLF
jgi:hypothetical protein